MKSSKSTLLIASLCLILHTLTGCMVGPKYQQPDLSTLTPKQWQAAQPHHGDPKKMIDFWKNFNDPLLTELIDSAQKNSPTLTQALLKLDYAQAFTKVQYSDLLPSLNSSASITKSHTEQVYIPKIAQKNTQLSFNSSWELDLFGEKRAKILQAEANEGAAGIQWHHARISLAAEVASNYIHLRACQAQVQLLNQTMDSYTKTLQLMQQQIRAGFISQADAVAVETNLKLLEDNKITQNSQCDLFIKSLVALSNMEEPILRNNLEKNYGIINDVTGFELPVIPAQALAQRPDLAIAERQLAAASYKINETEAQRYPRLSLLGNLSFGNVSFNGKTDHTQNWSFGPSLTIPIVDMYARKQAAYGATLEYRQALESYKQLVRDAVREVEETLVKLDTSQQRKQSTKNIITKNDELYTLTEKRYQAGFSTRLELENVRRQQLNSQISAINVQRDHTLNWILLYRAVGGDWKLQTNEGTPQ